MELTIPDIALYSIALFFAGFFTQFLILYIISHRNTYKVERFYAYLPQARDVYNQILFKLDRECIDFQVKKIKLKFDKKCNAYKLVLKYKSLNGKRFTF